MDHKDFSNLGEQLRRGVQSAIDSIDFKQISGTIKDGLNDAVSQAHSGLEHARMAAREGKRQATPPPPPMPPAVRVRRVGRVSGVLYIVFGALGLVLFGAAAAIGLFGAMVVSAPLRHVIPAAILAALPIGGFAYMIGAGSAMRGRLSRLKQYVDAAKTLGYCQISRLAARVHRSETFVLRDLRKMLRRGMLPDAHVDEQGGCLILDESVYQLYLQSRQEAEERRQAAEAPPTSAPQPTAGQAEAETVLEKGRACIEALREADRAIGKAEISARLRKLEAVLQSIFDSLQRHPDQIGEMQKFIEYYLPTTVKLVQAYRDFDQVGVQGENLQSAKAEIAKTLDTINEAFERVLNDLYQDAAFDAAADASVLQAMLAKDGWGGSDFEKEAHK